MKYVKESFLSESLTCLFFFAFLNCFLFFKLCYSPWLQVFWILLSPQLFAGFVGLLINCSKLLELSIAHWRFPKSYSEWESFHFPLRNTGDLWHTKINQTFICRRSSLTDFGVLQYDRPKALSFEIYGNLNMTKGYNR